MAYTSTTLATLRGRVRERLLTSFWSDTELTAYIKEAIRVWNVLTSYFQDTTTVSTFAGSTNGHSVASVISSTCLVPIRFVDQTTNTVLDAVSLDEIAGLSPTWLSDTTGAPSKWIPAGLDRFYVHPIASTNTLIVDYIATATLPSADGSYIQIGEEDLQAIIDYTVFVAHIKEGGAELQACMPLFQSFLRQAAKYNDKIKHLIVYNKFVGRSQQDTRS